MFAFYLNVSKQAIAFLFLAVIFVPETSGLPSGPPRSACENLMPKHVGIRPQTSAIPYTIDFTESTYTPGEPITVRINGGGFKGFIIQARQAEGGEFTPIGMFSDPPENTKLMKCDNIDDTLSHSNTEGKSSIAFTWNPPKKGMGAVRFYATIAKEREMYWTGLKSGILNPNVPDADAKGKGSNEKNIKLVTIILSVSAAFLRNYFV